MSGAYLHLGIVYLVWGSTYLAIRVAVREGSGFPPFSMGATRVILAGLLLLGWAALSRKRVRPSRRVGRSRLRLRAAQPSSSRPARITREAPMLKGGNPDPSRTATRMAR